MMNLNEDVLFQILLRLPVKKLVQFRCVCIAWYTLIKSSRFTYEHLAFQRAYGAGEDERIILKYFNYAERKDVVSIYDDYESLSLFASPETIIPDSHYLDFVGEANGIFCLSSKYNISLTNPVLREFIMIPNPAFYGRVFSAHQVGIGFAFDESTNDYKILRVDRVDDDKVGQYKVGALYIKSNNSWKELGRIPLLDSVDLNSHSCSVFVNGSIHWHAKGSSLEDRIFAFNITTELFQEVHAPKQLQDNPYAPPPVLFVLEKSFLALVSFSRSEVSSALLFTVWVMKEYGVADSWTREYCIETIPTIQRPLCFWKKDKLVFASNERELICHDLSTGQLHQLQRFSSTRFDKFGLMVFNESLISIT